MCVEYEEVRGVGEGKKRIYKGKKNIGVYVVHKQ